MLARPQACEGCPLHPIASGFMAPTLAGEDRYHVTLLGEALGEQEAEVGSPFVGPAGFKLTRLIEWAGLERSRFDILNSAWCRPPSNALEGQPYERPAIAHCREAHWDHLLSRSRVVVPLGNVPMGALLGRKGILKARGYVYGGQGYHIIPTVHPSFIQRGQSKYSAPFIQDIQKAVQLAREGLPPEPVTYLLDPLPARAYAWALAYRELLLQNPGLKLAYDIETHGKGEDEGELDEDPTSNILRIGFSYAALDGLSVPWSPEYIPAIRLLLESPGPKVVWNGAFDNPRLAAAGVPVRGLIHDGMLAWHILHSDLPKGLGFVATFTCPWQHEWKSLSHAKPAFYNAIDADVEWRSMDVIERELRRTGLWDVYQRDVLDLEPILLHMQTVGMPVDAERRLDYARRLDDRIRGVLHEMELLVPTEARRIDHVYAKPPKLIEGLESRSARQGVARCSVCGAVRPRKDHFRKLVKRTNPCAGGSTVVREESVVEYYRLAPWTPSRDHLMRYQRALGRPVPMKWDKKRGERRPSMDEEAIKKLIKAHPLDKLYPLVLQYRSLDKIAGTYIGRPMQDDAARPRD